MRLAKRLVMCKKHAEDLRVRGYDVPLEPPIRRRPRGAAIPCPVARGKDIEYGNIVALRPPSVDGTPSGARPHVSAEFFNSVAMPVVPKGTLYNQHRQKIGSRLNLLNAFLARPVYKNEWKIIIISFVSVLILVATIATWTTRDKQEQTRYETREANGASKSRVSQLRKFPHAIQTDGYG